MKAPVICLGKGMNSEHFEPVVRAVLHRAPQWLRHDFASPDPSARERAEDALAATLLAALASDAKDVDPA